MWYNQINNFRLLLNHMFLRRIQKGYPNSWWINSRLKEYSLCPSSKWMLLCYYAKWSKVIEKCSLCSEVYALPTTLHPGRMYWYKQTGDKSNGIDSSLAGDRCFPVFLSPWTHELSLPRADVVCGRKGSAEGIVLHLQLLP